MAEGMVHRAPGGITTPHIERLLEGAVVVAALATIPVVVVEEQGVDDPLIAVADWVTWAVFAADYVILAALSTDRRRYLRGN